MFKYPETLITVKELSPTIVIIKKVIKKEQEHSTLWMKGITLNGLGLQLPT